MVEAVGLTTIEEPVLPLLQLYATPVLTVSVVVLPLHIILPPLITGDGNEITLTVTLSVAVHPLTSVTVTVYVVVKEGLTDISEVVLPLLQLYNTPPLAVSVAFVPVQIILLPLIVGLGN